MSFLKYSPKSIYYYFRAKSMKNKLQEIMYEGEDLIVEQITQIIRARFRIERDLWIEDTVTGERYSEFGMTVPSFSTLSIRPFVLKNKMTFYPDWEVYCGDNRIIY